MNINKREGEGFITGGSNNTKQGGKCLRTKLKCIFPECRLDLILSRFIVSICS